MSYDERQCDICCRSCDEKDLTSYEPRPVYLCLLHANQLCDVASSDPDFVTWGVMVYYAVLGVADFLQWGTGLMR